MRVKIHHEGTNILIVSFLILALAVTPIWIWGALWLAITLTAAFGVLYFFMVNFFRSPHRYFKGERENVVVSSADGTVVALEQTYENEVLKCECIQLSVFMTILNVHANWFPVDGIVKLVRHHAGRFLSAYLPKSSTENERSTILIRTVGGQDVLVRQVAGAMARRIVTYAEPGEEANIEDHLGFIKFGSRVDIYLPLGTEILVKLGDKTIGGITPVARLKPSQNPIPEAK